MIAEDEYPSGSTFPHYLYLSLDSSFRLRPAGCTGGRKTARVDVVPEKHDYALVRGFRQVAAQRSKHRLAVRIRGTGVSDEEYAGGQVGGRDRGNLRRNRQLGRAGQQGQ